MPKSLTLNDLERSKRIKSEVADISFTSQSHFRTTNLVPSEGEIRLSITE